MTTAPQDKFMLVGHTLDAKFRIERVVTEGGFGILYYGTHLMLDRPIALKVLKVPGGFSESARKTFVEGFAREAKTIVKISHPNIVQVLDFGVSAMPNGETSPWMVLEWLAGPTLREALVQRRGRGGQTPAEVLALLRPTLEALAYAHDEGIAHRDLKPANMMLVPTKRGNVLKLLDFGIAKVMEDGEEAGTGHTQTASTMNAFSLAYAAPEQIGGSRTGPWTDVHAMALIITELLTDFPPYDGKERTEICVDALSARRPSPSKRNIDIGTWEPVLLKALALRPADRFSNAGELLQALDAALPGAVPSMGPGGSYAAGPGRAAALAAIPMGAPPVQQEIGQNPTTLRGMTTGTAPSNSGGGNGRIRLVGPLVLIGVVAIGAAVALQFRGRSAAAPAVSVPATSVTSVANAPAVPSTPQQSPVVIPAASPVVAAPTPPAPVVAAPSAAQAVNTPPPAAPAAPAEAAPANVTGTRTSGSRSRHGSSSGARTTGSHGSHGSAANQNVDVD